MSVIKPEINKLTDKTEHNPFLLCTVASKRACDINNMLRSQHLRVVNASEVDDVTTMVSGKDTVSIAMTELNDGLLGFDEESFARELHDTDDITF